MDFYKRRRAPLTMSRSRNAPARCSKGVEVNRVARYGAEVSCNARVTGTVSELETNTDQDRAEFILLF